MRASAYLDIAERTFGSRGSLALLRWALAIVFLWFGGMKFTSYEAHGNAPLIDHSPVMSWLNVVFGVQGASYVIGVIELSTAVMLILGAFNAAASALGAVMQRDICHYAFVFFDHTGSSGADRRWVPGDIRADRAVPA
jgi:uncharacterized membrane protein YkgB